MNDKDGNVNQVIVKFDNMESGAKLDKTRQKHFVTNIQRAHQFQNYTSTTVSVENKLLKDKRLYVFSFGWAMP